MCTTVFCPLRTVGLRALSGAAHDADGGHGRRTALSLAMKKSPQLLRTQSEIARRGPDTPRSLVSSRSRLFSK